MPKISDTMIFFSVPRLPKPLLAITGATLLSGTATPLLKILVDGMAPLLLIALLALGSGASILCWRIIRHPYPAGSRPDPYREGK